ncbi:MAG: Rv2993c-like domain-containing protein [Thermoleophilaceae bacterium]
MRLVSFESGGEIQAGMLRGDNVAVLGRGGVGALLRRGALPVEASGDTVALAGVRLLAPVPDPGKIVCIGLNYHAHAAEQGAQAPETPTIFAKFPNALAPVGAAPWRSSPRDSRRGWAPRRDRDRAHLERRGDAGAAPPTSCTQFRRWWPTCRS